MYSLDIDGLYYWLSLDNLTVWCSLHIDGLYYWLDLYGLTVICKLDIYWWMVLLNELRLFNWLCVEIEMLVLNVFWYDCHELFRMFWGATVSFINGVVYLVGTMSYGTTTWYVLYRIIRLICVSDGITRLFYCQVPPNRKLIVLIPNGTNIGPLIRYILYSPFYV